MAKKAQSKKAAKKSVKKAPTKAVKKSAKTAKKAKAKTVVKAAKKAVKKAVAKKSSPKKVAKKVVKKVAPKKAAVKKITKKVVKKAAVKKVVASAKKTIKKAVKRITQVKKENTIGSISHAIGDFVKNAVNTVVDKVSHMRDAELASSQPSESQSHAEDKKQEPSSSNDKTEEERRFKAHRTSLKVGDKAPYFEGKEQNGNTVSLKAFAGKKLILYFYPKDDTPGCTATACSLRDEHTYFDENNYAIVGISGDNEKSHAKFAAKYELPFTLIADNDREIMRSYDVWGEKMMMGKIYDGVIRTTFLIDEKGIIAHVITDVDTVNHAQQIRAM